MLLNDQGVTHLRHGNYGASIVCFRGATQALCHIVTDAEDVMDWLFRLKLAPSPVCTGDVVTERGCVLSTQVYAFEIPDQVDGLSCVEKAIIGTTLMFNLGLCYQMKSFLPGSPRSMSMDLYRARLLYESATRTSCAVVDASLGPLPQDLTVFLVGIGNNLGCIGAEMNDQHVIQACMAWHWRVGECMDGAPSVLLNHLFWQSTQSSPSPAA